MPNAVRPGYRLYPRGFVGGVVSPRAKKAGESLAQQVLQHTSASEDGVNEFFPYQNANGGYATGGNPDVEALYASYMKQSGGVTSFDFRTKVLKAALQAFGTGDFQFWIMQQRTSPGYGDLHRRFIRDIVRYLRGERRELSLDVWDPLLVIENGATGVDLPDPLIEEFFAVWPEAKQVSKVVQMWCQRHNGIEDLIVSLHLLFGDIQ